MRYLVLLLLLVGTSLAVPCIQAPDSWFDNVQIIVGSKAKISDGVVASNLASLIAWGNIRVYKSRINLSTSPRLLLNISGKLYNITMDTTILPYNITVEDLTCSITPNYYWNYRLEVPNVTDMVILDNQPLKAKHFIVIGSYWVNKYSQWTRKVIKRPGDWICDWEGDFIWVAGWTAEDTIHASVPLIQKLKYRRPKVVE